MVVVVLMLVLDTMLLIASILRTARPTALASVASRYWLTVGSALSRCTNVIMLAFLHRIDAAEVGSPTPAKAASTAAESRGGGSSGRAGWISARASAVDVNTITPAPLRRAVALDHADGSRRRKCEERARVAVTRVPLDRLTLSVVRLYMYSCTT